MRRAAIFLLLCGLLVTTGLVVSQGAGAIWHALAGIGWRGFGLVCLYHLGLIGLMGLSWCVIVTAASTAGSKTGGVKRAGCGVFVWARLVRDSVAEILPLSQLGGFAMGARAASLAGVSGVVAVASTIVDVTLELLAQLAFTALGLGLLIIVKPNTGMAVPVAAGIGVMSVAAIGFVVAQRRGLSLIERIADRLLGDWARYGLSLSAVHFAIAAIYHRAGRVWLCVVLHLVCWFASAAEAWLALHLMGVAIGLGPVIAVESLLYAIRSVAFAVPNALGVQEGSYLILGGVFGLAPETLLALSLLKRARDLALGLPTLLLWQAIEARHAFRPPPVPAMFGEGPVAADSDASSGTAAPLGSGHAQPGHAEPGHGYEDPVDRRRRRG
jgi:putative membrane protein